MCSFIPKTVSPFVLLVIFFGALLLMPCSAAAQARSTGVVTGVVVDSASKAGLEFANVFLAHTTIGTTSDEHGKFTLHSVPAGLYNIVVSLVGYDRKIVPIFVRRRDTLRLTVVLGVRVIAAGEVSVEAESPRAWQRSLKRFEEAFFGEGNPRDCRLLNPEVLNFHEEGTTLTAWTDSLLRVQNPFLGYNVTLALRQFRWGLYEDTGCCVIFPYFAETPTGNESQREKWFSHRHDVYKGSLEHFLKAIVLHQIREQGFQVKSGTLSMGFPKPYPDEEIETSQYMNTPFVEWIPPGWLRIEYWGHTGDVNYIHRLGTRIIVDSSGVLLTPLAITVQGEWSRKRIGDMLPMEIEMKEQP